MVLADTSAPLAKLDASDDRRDQAIETLDAARADDVELRTPECVVVEMISPVQRHLG